MEEKDTQYMHEGVSIEWSGREDAPTIHLLFLLLEYKGMNSLVRVTREEVDVIRKTAPHTHIAIVNRGKRNKHYYAEENKSVRAIIRRMRQGQTAPRS